MTRVVEIPAAAAAHLAARRAVGQPQTAPSQAGPPLSPVDTGPSSLRIAYLIPRTDVGGGARILLEHARRLADRGHEVVTVANTAPPQWTQVGGTWCRLPPGLPLAAAVPDVDVLVAGYWEMLGAASLLSTCPVVHFEQGDFHLYEALPPDMESLVADALRATPLHMTVSGRTAAVMQDRYGVQAAVLHNAVDRSVFRPDGPVERGRARRLLCVGSDANAFKGIDDVVTAWRAVRARGEDVELTWVTPRPPLQAVPDVRVVVSPDQQRLAAEYRSADVYVSGSRYESFPLPPLEAMSCGTPVVTTANVGVLEYARDGDNALLTPVQDPQALAAALHRVLTDDALATKLRLGGRRTSEAFDWEAVVDRLERLLQAAARRPPARRASGSPAQHWRIDLRGGSFDQPHGLRRLHDVLRHTTAGRVALPLRQPALDGHDLVRWRIVAERRGARPSSATVQAWLPLTSAERLADHRHQAALDALTAGRPHEAVALLKAAAPVEPAARAPLGTWLVLALLEAERDDEAVDVAQAALLDHPEHPDLYYVAALAASFSNVAVDLRAAEEAVQSLQAGAASEEWLAEPEQLLTRVSGADGQG